MRIRSYEINTQEMLLKQFIKQSFDGLENREEMINAAVNIAEWYRTLPTEGPLTTDLTGNSDIVVVPNSTNDTNDQMRSLYKKSGRNATKRKNNFLPLKNTKRSHGEPSEFIDLTIDSVPELKESSKKESKDHYVPSSMLTDIVGVRPVLIKICCFLYRFLQNKEGRKGMLLYGPGGCGKTLLAHSIAGHLGLPLYEYTATDLMANNSDKKLSHLRDKVKKSGCVVLFDQIGMPMKHSEPFHRLNLTNQLRKTIDDIHNTTTNVLIIATCENLEDVDESLRGHGRLQTSYQLGIPSEAERFKLLLKFCSQLVCDDALDLRHVSSLCPGYTGGELKVFVDEVRNHVEDIQYFGEDLSLVGAETDKLEIQFHKILEKLENPEVKVENSMIPLKTEHFEYCVCQAKSSLQTKRSGEIPRVKWSDVGALEHVKEELKLNFLAPIRYKSRIGSYGGGGDGILLVGPPGCGKTMLAKALANEAGLNFFGVSGPELINKYVGESERAIRDLFCEARSRAPSVIFFDEIDGICPSRHGVEDGAHSSRFVSQMLTELNGLNERSQVYVLAATNRPDRVDPAIRRHGRIGITIFVGIPTTEDRRTILCAITKNGTEPKMADDVDFNALSEDRRLENFTGADLQALVDKAVRVALKEIIMYDPDGKEPIYITGSHFEKALEEGIRPSLTQKMMNLYCNKMNNF